MHAAFRRVLLTLAGVLLVVPRLAAQELSLPELLKDMRPPAAAASQQGNENGEESDEAEEPREEEPGENRVETDRDAFTPITRTVERGLFTLESAYSFIDNRRVADTHSFPEMLLRYGLLKRLELRLGWNYEVGGSGNIISGEQGDAVLEGGRIARENRINYGFKAQLTEQRKWVPQSAFITEMFTPTGGRATATQVACTYVFGWSLPNRWRLDSAMRYANGSEEEDHFNIWAPSVVLRVPLGERWGVHAEYFGIFSQGQAVDSTNHYFSPGFHYLVTRNLEVGVRVGWGLNNQSARFFSNVGFGWRF